MPTIKTTWRPALAAANISERSSRDSVISIQQAQRECAAHHSLIIDFCLATAVGIGYLHSLRYSTGNVKISALPNIEYRLDHVLWRLPMSLRRPLLYALVAGL